LTIASTGVIEADGTAGATGGGPPADLAAGGGSGGSIYIATGTLAGSGAIHADGGDGGATAKGDGGGGGGGRIAIHYTSSTYTGSTSAGGGAPGGGAATAGAAGTNVTDDILWKTYKDSGYTDDEDVFDDYATEHIVYVTGTGFANGGVNYTIVFWDALGAKIQVATGQAGPDLSSQRTFSKDPRDPSGTWYASVYPNGLDPASHSTTTNLKADYAFKVEEAAIPEFSTVIAAIAVAGLCFGIYYWMMRRYQRVEVYTKNLNRLGGRG